jgi:hypothetical protein
VCTAILTNFTTDQLTHTPPAKETEHGTSLQYSHIYIYIYIKYIYCYLYISSGDGMEVCTATGYGLDGQGSIPSKVKGFFSIPQHPHKIWAPFILFFQQGSFLRVK